MKLIQIDKANAGRVAPLAAQFRVTLRSFKGIRSQPDVENAGEEILELLEAGYPIYAAEEEGELAGYIVCRIEEPCLWVEHIFVCSKYRRKGVATALFQRAEEIAASMGEDTVFNYVHPNNEAMIGFLRSKGYTVLNMIEIRKPCRGEKLTTTVRVDDKVFDY